MPLGEPRLINLPAVTTGTGGMTLRIPESHREFTISRNHSFAMMVTMAVQAGTIRIAVKCQVSLPIQRRHVGMATPALHFKIRYRRQVAIDGCHKKVAVLARRVAVSGAGCFAGSARQKPQPQDQRHRKGMGCQRKADDSTRFN